MDGEERIVVQSQMHMVQGSELAFIMNQHKVGKVMSENCSFLFSLISICLGNQQRCLTQAGDLWT